MLGFAAYELDYLFGLSDLGKSIDVYTTRNKMWPRQQSNLNVASDLSVLCYSIKMFTLNLIETFEITNIT